MDGLPCGDSLASNLHSASFSSLMCFVSHPCKIATKKASDCSHPGEHATTECAMSTKHRNVVRSGYFQNRHRSFRSHVFPCSHPSCLLCWLCFVNPPLQYGYKENVRRSSMHLAFLLCFIIAMICIQTISGSSFQWIL